MSQKRKKNTRPQQKSQQQVQQAQPLPGAHRKKSTPMRILVLIMAFAVFAGFIIMPLLSHSNF